MTNPYLKIDQIHKQFGSFTALNDISIDINKKEFVCLLGPSGCGKTTLLRIIAGLEEATTGSIFMNGQDISTLPPARRNFGIVFQSYALFPNLTALQNIEFGLKARKINKKEAREKALESLALVDLLKQKDKYPAQMSGGQQQRIALARAIALSPDFLLLDEPLSALDAKVREKLRREIRSIQEKLQITTIMVTHDQDEALSMADKIVVMNNAEVMQIGTPQEVYQTPANPFIADFIGSINFWENAEPTRDVENTFAIRPEHIRLSNKEGILSKVEDIEFRGPIYRVQFKVIDSSSYLYGRSIKVDVSTHDVHTFNLSKGVNTHISLPAERILTYKGQVVV
ncbi:putative 2-aminoethylphosphonate ABC transporter ATP-binding protein [Peribacillus asahii]|uniref:putative 2-aminoethylphosphonate ABC transporter ATP-binding protein n=1 Tax=Peribacillus asahii TaxID=228899 RepID=UPI00207928B3|nr:putative 2-aminoethylphosphonate ABC transporter ATP-binding protein [Peribacillus asahii]USK86926.1 putative 2-aminoethylphosphonate ABC transporter ATP-binding protein [Peribacillus asahii]